MPLDAFLAAADDLLAILRAMWRAERDPGRRRTLAAAGRNVKAAIAIAAQHEAGTPEYRQAMSRVDQAMNAVFNSMHFNEQLAPVVGSAVSHLRKAR